MEFIDPELRRHFERVLPLTTDLPKELRPIAALMDAYGRFRADGELGARIREEVLQKLVAPESRSALRSWYHHGIGKMNPSAAEFRDQLSKLVGEEL